MTVSQIINDIILNNSIENYLLCLLSIFFSIIIGRYMDALIERLADKLNKKKELEFDEVIVRALSLPIAIAIVLSGFYLGFNFLYTPQDLKTMINEGISTAFIICIIVFFDRFVSELVEKYLADAISKRTRMEIDDQIIIRS